MLSLHTNAASLSTQNSLSSTNKSLSASMTKLGTGYRVNSAMDDAAGLQIATRLNAQSRGMQVAQKNTQNGISMLQTAEGAMNEIGEMLLRMKDLATESANGTATDKDRAALQAEYSALGQEIGNILKNTSFAGSKLFSDDTKNIGTAGALQAGGTLGVAAGITFQVGATAAETIDFSAGAADGSLTALMTSLNTISNQIGDGKVTYTLTQENAGLSDLETQAAAITTYDATTHDPIFGSESAFDGLVASGSTKTTAFTTATTNIALLNKTYAETGTTYADEDAFLAAQETAKSALTAAGFTFTSKPEEGEELLTVAKASAQITDLNKAIEAVGTFRSDLGAVANRLDHTYNNLSNMITNTDAAKGRIMDVDYATETSNMTSKNMLMQASTSMLKQANNMSQMVSSLLQ